MANAKLKSMLRRKRSMKARVGDWGHGWGTGGWMIRGKQGTEGPRMLRPAVAFVRIYVI